MRSKSTKFLALRSVVAFTPYLCLYGGIAFGFYWLMQPTVMPNQGIAAYKPPPLAVVTYPDRPSLPPAGTEPAPAPVLAMTPAPEPEKTVGAAPAAPEAPVAAPAAEKHERKVTRKREARAAPRRERAERTERVARDRWGPRWNFAFGASNNGGFRPWF